MLQASCRNSCNCIKMRIKVTILTIYCCLHHEVKLIRDMLLKTMKRRMVITSVAIANEPEKYIVICGFRPKTQHGSTIQCWPW